MLTIPTVVMLMMGDNVHLEEGELFFSEGSDGAGDEGALGEAAVELGKEGLVPGHLPPAQEPLLPRHLLHQVPLILSLLVLADCQTLGSLEHLKMTRKLLKHKDSKGQRIGQQIFEVQKVLNFHFCLLSHLCCFLIPLILELLKLLPI